VLDQMPKQVLEQAVGQAQKEEVSALKGLTQAKG
jgi:hypothetical protein